ncbi:MAG: AMP nucleosidase [Kiloniellales bacterium]|nr:AMP nucleosidase [Kiloniellales bacterium]
MRSPKTPAAFAQDQVRDLRAYKDAESAVARICEIYARSTERVRKDFEAATRGDLDGPAQEASYPYVGVVIGPEQLRLGDPLAYGKLPGADAYATTVSRPDLFKDYYKEQIELIIKNHRRPVHVGVSSRPIPLTFVVEEATEGLSAERIQQLRSAFPLPDLSVISDSVANGTHVPVPGTPKPLALFSGPRVDYSLVRLFHYTGTSPLYFQRFVLFTNYQRYVDEFVTFGHAQVSEGEEYAAFVEPGNVVTPNARISNLEAGGCKPQHLPQMPAYHLMREDGDGITLVNIGIGPSNAKTITDHLAVLRPHCWLMVGHCGGLRGTQQLGDYVLAHAYVRGDHVLDEDLPDWVPVPPIAEVQIALTESVAKITGLRGRELKVRLRTGTIYTTDDRDWELRRDDLARRFNQSRAIAVDMESATIAANGFRLRVPYGTLLCVSDKPLHGEIKLPGMANAFYRERVGQHLQIGIHTLCSLRDAGVETLHSRKLRSFDEPAFR